MNIIKKIPQTWELVNPSRNLIDTIHEMEAVQDWMVDYRREMKYDKGIGTVGGHGNLCG